MSARRSRRRRGFTLMEVLLVLAILVVLGSMVTVGYLRIQQGANRDAAKTQIKLLESAVDVYSLHVGTYPTASQGLNALIAAPADLKNPAKWQGPYLKEMPRDPWGQDYLYEEIQDTQGQASFKIYSYGPDGQAGNDDVDPFVERQQSAAAGS
jgi:general secretion pathway protein G